MEHDCYVVMLRNDRDYDENEEWVDRIFESLDDAYTYLVDDLGFTLVSEETLFFVRRVKEGEPERFYGECNESNGSQSAWIDKKKFMPNEWSRWEVCC